MAARGWERPRKWRHRGSAAPFSVLPRGGTSLLQRWRRDFGEWPPMALSTADLPYDKCELIEVTEPGYAPLTVSGVSYSGDVPAA
jgi:hypothetical protein